MTHETPHKEGAKKFKPHVSKYKQGVVHDLVKLMKEYPIVGAVNMENMPAASLQSMRGQLRGQVEILMTKRRVMKHAFEEAKGSKKGIEKLVPHLKGMPALLFTKENPFKLFKTIKSNKTAAPAKPGQIAPQDIVVKAGPTPFVPGPVIGELGALGLKTEVKNGKINIKQDATIVKEGQAIKPNVASMLLRLGIQPMEIGLELVAVYEDGVIYDKKVLDVDEKAFMKNLQDAARWAFNLAVEAGYFTKETVEALVPKAFREARAVAMEANIINDATRDEILAKAEMQMLSLKEAAHIPDAPPKAETIEEKREEIKQEEKHIQEELQHIKKEIEHEMPHPNVKHIQKIEKEVHKVEKELEKVDIEKKELPSTEKIILAAIEANKAKKAEERHEGAPERHIDLAKKRAADESEKLFKELKKKGTLRGINQKQ